MQQPIEQTLSDIVNNPSFIESKLLLQMLSMFIKNVDSIPDIRFFEADFMKLNQQTEEARVESIRKLLYEKRYIVLSQYDDYKVPNVPVKKDAHDYYYYGDMGKENEVKLKLWLPEFNSICVTLLLDDFIHKNMPEGGYIYLFPEETSYLSLLNIETISSGFRFVNSGPCEPRESCEFIRLAVSPQHIKDEIIVSTDVPYGWMSFLHCEPHKVSTANYGNKYILNFAVCGEFDLSIYYQPKGQDLHFLTTMGFCCK